MKYMLLYVNVDFISAVLQTGGVQARPRPGLELRLRRERERDCPSVPWAILVSVWSDGAEVLAGWLDT